MKAAAITPKCASLRKCKNRACRARFSPPEKNPFKVACCTGCEIILSKLYIEKVNAARAKKKRKDTKVKLMSLKGLSYWEGRAQRAVNKFIRLRDQGQPCISCGTPYSTVWQAGHFISVGANSTLRFIEDNIHLQCVQCNTDKSGNAAEYRRRLVGKIGLVRVEALEAWHSPVKSTVHECMAIEARYAAKAKALLGQSKA